MEETTISTSLIFFMFCLFADIYMYVSQSLVKLDYILLEMNGRIKVRVLESLFPVDNYYFINGTFLQVKGVTMHLVSSDSSR